MQQTMFIYESDWYGQKTFKMLPIDCNCPYNEAIYDPSTKVLAIISKEHKEKPQMLPKLNGKGQLVTKSSNTAEPAKNIEERIMMDSYYEYYLDNIDDINEFIKFFANNKPKILDILKV